MPKVKSTLSHVCDIFQNTLRRGWNVDAVYYTGDTLLHKLVKANMESEVAVILAMGASVNVRNRYSQTPLHIALTKGFGNIVGQLVDRSASLTEEDIFGKTPLDLALTRKKTKMLEILLNKGLEVNLADCTGRTLLHYAVESTASGSVELLLNRGAEVNALDFEFFSPLHLAKNMNVLKRLLNKGADLEQKTCFGTTPLHVFVNAKFEAGVHLLLDKGALPNDEDIGGNTALHYAVLLKNLRMVEVLVNRGADIERENAKGVTPLNYAILFNDFKSGVAFLMNKRSEMFKEDKKIDNLHLAYLISSGNTNGNFDDLMDINKIDLYGYTLLHSAIEFQNVGLVKKLLEKDALVNIEGKNGQTPLHFALKNKFTSGVELLMKKRLAINTKDNRGKTALHYAIENGIFVEELLAQRADMYIQDNEGQLPIHLATKLERISEVKSLMERGGFVLALDKNCQTPLGLSYRCEVNNTVSQEFLKYAAANVDMSDYMMVSCADDLVSKLPCTEYGNLCLEELEKMKKNKCGNSSLDEIFFNYKNPKYVSDPLLIEALHSPTLDSEYPIYASLLRITFEKAKSRNHNMDDLLLKVIVDTNDVEEKIVVLPNEITRYVLSYLSDKDLFNLLLAYKNNFECSLAAARMQIWAGAYFTSTFVLNT